MSPKVLVELAYFEIRICHLEHAFGLRGYVDILSHLVAMHHLETNSLVTLLARLIVMCITERAQRYLSDNRMTNPNLQRYLLGWRISRLGFVTPIVGEVSLGPLGNAHHYKSCKQCD